MRRLLLLATAILVICSRQAAGQDDPRFGLVLGYPSQVAVLVGVGDRLALRPEFTWSQSKIESSGGSILFGSTIVPPVVATFTTTTKELTTGVGISGLLYLSRSDALRIYVSPRFSYSRTRVTNETVSSVPSRTDSSTATGSTFTTAGSIGAQYSLAMHFGVFGELGIAYSRLRPPSYTSLSDIISVPRPTGWNLGVRSSAGVILFF